MLYIHENTHIPVFPPDVLNSYSGHPSLNKIFFDTSRISAAQATVARCFRLSVSIVSTSISIPLSVSCIGRRSDTIWSSSKMTIPRPFSDNALIRKRRNKICCCRIQKALIINFPCQFYGSHSPPEEVLTSRYFSLSNVVILF